MELITKLPDLTRLLGMATNQIFDGVRNALQNGTVFSVDFTTMGTILLVLIGLYTMEQCLIIFRKGFWLASRKT